MKTFEKNFPASRIEPPIAQRGVGMLEVLIAVLVIAIGALGFAGIQLTALKSSEDANYRAHATLIAQDAIERFLANPTELDLYTSLGSWQSGAVAPGGQPVNWKQCIDNACSSAEMARWDIEQLRWVTANSLPSGQLVTRACGFNGLDCVVVSWSEQIPADCITAVGINVAQDTSCLVMEVIR